jgi:hypothetical protein
MLNLIDTIEKKTNAVLFGNIFTIFIYIFIEIIMRNLETIQ